MEDDVDDVGSNKLLAVDEPVLFIDNLSYTSQSSPPTSILKAAALSAQKHSISKTTSTSQATSSSLSSPPALIKEYEFKPKPLKEQLSILSADDKNLLESERSRCMADVAESRKRADLAPSDRTGQLLEARLQQAKFATLADMALFLQRKAALLGNTGGGKRTTVQVDRQVVVEKVVQVGSQIDVDVSVSTPTSTPVVNHTTSSSSFSSPSSSSSSSSAIAGLNSTPSTVSTSASNTSSTGSNTSNPALSSITMHVPNSCATSIPSGMTSTKVSAARTDFSRPPSTEFDLSYAKAQREQLEMLEKNQSLAMQQVSHTLAVLAREDLSEKERSISGRLLADLSITLTQSQQMFEKAGGLRALHRLKRSD
jgi:hypothetical protein